MKEYKTLLFDIDGTLLDFKKAEFQIFLKTMLCIKHLVIII